MKYNEKYDRYVSKGGLVYRYDKKKDRLILSNQYYVHGYLVHNMKKDNRFIHLLVHRLVWETFNGEIPQGYEIDHINGVRDDNRLENLRCVTHAENINNPLTRNHISESKKGNIRSEFGAKFKEHFGITYYENTKLYKREQWWYLHHNKTCRWEKNV